MKKHEYALLARAARFVLAGEWPWEDGPDAEVNELERAADKAEARSEGAASRPRAAARA